MAPLGIRSALAFSIALAATGCATIVGQPAQTIPIASTPSDASIVITDEAGTEVFKGSTPTTATLPKSSGKYWGKKSYMVTIAKDGFATQTIPVTASANGWYIAGNFLFGGLIGWFIVDPMGGHMYSLSPEAVAATMPSNTAHNNSRHDGSIAIVMLQDVPAELRNKMVQLR